MCNFQFIYTMHAFSIYYFVWRTCLATLKSFVCEERIAPVTSFALAMASSLFLVVLVTVFLPNPQPLFSAASWSVREYTLFSQPDAGGALLKSTLLASIVYIWHKIHSCIKCSSVCMHVHHVLSIHKHVATLAAHTTLLFFNYHYACVSLPLIFLPLHLILATAQLLLFFF